MIYTQKWKNEINALKMINPKKLEHGQPTYLAFFNLSEKNLPTGAQMSPRFKPEVLYCQTTS
jgi:hypothetical protein